jgi:Mg2+ and Co2+ transporter CorA
MIEKRHNGDYKRWQDLLQRLEASRKIIDKLTTTLQYALDIQTNSSIDVLSKVSLIFLPLTFITGYFGMNFTSMGIVGKNMNPKGILMWKNGHTFVLLLLLFALVASIIILSFVEKYNSRNKNIRATLSALVQAQSSASDDLS